MTNKEAHIKTVQRLFAWAFLVGLLFTFHSLFPVITILVCILGVVGLIGYDIYMSVFNSIRGEGK